MLAARCRVMVTYREEQKEEEKGEGEDKGRQALRWLNKPSPISIALWSHSDLRQRLVPRA